MRIRTPLLLLGGLVISLGVVIGFGIAFEAVCPGAVCLMSATPAEDAPLKDCIDAMAKDGVQTCHTTDGRTVKVFGSDSAASVSEANITVTEPSAGASLGKTFTIAGQARVFENTVNYRVKDEDGTVLFKGFVIANAPDAGQFGSYTVNVKITKFKGTKGTIEVYQESAKDGSEIDKVTVPVSWKK